MSKMNELFQMMREKSGLDSDRIDAMEKRYEEEMEYKEWYYSKEAVRARHEQRIIMNQVFDMFHPYKINK